MPWGVIIVNTALSKTGRRSAVGILAAGSALALALAGASPAMAATSVLVPESQIGSTYAADNEVVWLAEDSAGGSHDVTTDVFDGRSAVKMMLSSTSSVVNVFRSYGVGTRPTAVAPLLDDASYSYAGSNVNFQLAMFYTPADLAAYGPSGSTSACTQAVDNGAQLADMCFTILKYETAQTTTGTYATIQLEGAQAPFAGPGNPGWWPTRSVGQYAANSRVATLDQLLGEMASYQVYAVGASVGKGTTVGDSWLLDLTFGGTSYQFGTAPIAEPATPPPATDSAGLEQLIVDDGIDVTQQTANFVPTGSGNNDLTAIDPTAPLTGEYQGWADPTDAFVDAYTFSTAQHVGTYRIVNGNVVMTGVNLSHLSKGTHYLVLRGQTSGAFVVVRMSVLGVLAATGVDAPRMAWTASLGGLAVVAGAFLLLVRSGLRFRAAARDGRSFPHLR